MGKVELHSIVQVGDNQSGFCTMSWSSSPLEIIDECSRACGCKERNKGILLRDNACIKFLGIEIDSIAMEIRLPANKLAMP